MRFSPHRAGDHGEHPWNCFDHSTHEDSLQRISTFLKVASIAFGLCGHPAAWAVSAAYVQAEAGSYVGGTLPGRQATFVDGVNASVRSFTQGDRSAYIYTENWSFIFAAPRFSPIDGLSMPRALMVGRYDAATRYPFNGATSPGMDVFGDSRGYNVLSGWFQVLEVSYSPGFDVLSLAVDFAEYGENLTQSGPALVGSVRFNSAIPLTIPSPIPEPGLLPLLSIGLLALALRTRRSRPRAV